MSDTNEVLEHSNEVLNLHNERKRKRQGEELLKVLPQGEGSGLNADMVDDLHAEELVEKCRKSIVVKAGGSGGGGGISQSVADGLYVNVSGDTMTGDLEIDHINEATATHGVNIDGVLCKDSVIPDAAYPNALLVDGTRGIVTEKRIWWDVGSHRCYITNMNINTGLYGESLYMYSWDYMGFEAPNTKFNSTTVTFNSDKINFYKSGIVLQAQYGFPIRCYNTGVPAYVDVMKFYGNIAAPYVDIPLAGDITGLATKTIDMPNYKVSGVAGVDGSFTTVDGKTVTVTKGIITSIV